jgi:phosphate transport system substrate-binding protein
MRELGKDPYAIAYSGVAAQTNQVKSLPLAVKDGAPYVPFTLQTVTARTYPLTRSMYAYVNAGPGKPIDPKIAEFLRFILSRQGQQSVALQKIFLALPLAAVVEQRKKLEAVAR